MDEKGEVLKFAIEPLRWGGVFGDKERLLVKAEEGEIKTGELGKMSWEEIGNEMEKVAKKKKSEIAVMISGVKRVHDKVLEYYTVLPEIEKPLYHNIGRWDEGSGHADQVMILAARELIGAMKIKDIDLPLSEIGAILKAISMHDIDWMTGRQDNGEEIDPELLIEQVLGEEIVGDEKKIIKGVYNALKYGEGKTPKDLADITGWNLKKAEVVYEIVRRSDLLQVTDASYPAQDQIFDDFNRLRSEYLDKWGWRSPSDALPDENFLEFAQKKVFSNGEASLRYHNAFSPEEAGLVLFGWNKFVKFINDRKIK